MRLDIRIGRKNYSIEAVIAKVKTPLLGWDFFMKYRLDLIWGEFGDLFLRDKKANIAKRLTHVAIPHKAIPRLIASSATATISNEARNLNAGAKLLLHSDL